MGHLDEVDLSLSLSSDEEERRLEAGRRRLLQLRLVCGGQVGGRLGPPIIVVFEGWDASGKGGAITRLVGGLDPRHYSVVQFAAPSTREKRHHFLWRFWPHLPGDGGMVVFDRSWYGRVLVERVEGLATEAQWRRAYKEIDDFEAGLAAEGAVLAKFWMHISDEEQMRRFERRRDDPLKSWKLTDEDWRNRGQRELYVLAVEEMIDQTSRPDARWHVVPAESKRYARVHVLETTIRLLEEGMARVGMEVPEPVR